MKVCSKCKLEKPEEEFNYKYKDRGIRQYHCRSCSKKLIRRHYVANRSYYLQKARKRNDWLRQITKEYVRNYLSSHPCVDCGESDPVVLEFDHLSDKIAPVSSLRRNGTLEKVKLEIAKCEVRCANCHRRKTAERASLI